MQRIFKYDDIQNTTLTLDKEVNISIHETPYYVVLYTRYKLLKMIRFSSTPCINHKRSIQDLSAVTCNTVLPGVTELLYYRLQLQRVSQVATWYGSRTGCGKYRESYCPHRLHHPRW